MSHSPTAATPTPSTASAPSRAGRRRVAALLLGGLVLQLLLGLSALWTARSGPPHDLRIAVVASTPNRAEQVVQALRSASVGALHPVAVVDTAHARRAIGDRSVEAAFLVGAGSTDELIVASAAGPAQSVLLASRFRAFDATRKRTLTVVDSVPLPPADRHGVAVVLLTAVLLLGGCLGAAALAPPSQGPRAGLRRLGVLMAYALVSATVVVLGCRGALGLLRGHEVQAVAAAALVSAAAATVTAALLRAAGGLVTAGVLAVLAVLGVGAAGTLPYAFRPEPFRSAGPFLPSGAGQDLLRNLTYFHGHATGRPLLVLAAWTLVGGAVAAVTAGRGHRDTVDQHGSERVRRVAVGV